jgi:hypothetical protein
MHSVEESDVIKPEIQSYPLKPASEDERIVMNERTMTLHVRRPATPLSRLTRAALIVALGAFIQAVPASAQESASLGLPDVPTTRVLAIGHLTAKSNPKAMGAVLPEEVRDTVKLYLAGKIDQWYVRKDQASVVFILDVASVKEAHETFSQLPFGRADLMEFDLIPLGPLSPLAALGDAPSR